MTRGPPAPVRRRFDWFMLLVGVTLVTIPWLLAAMMYELEHIDRAWLELFHQFHLPIDITFMIVFVSGCGIALVAIFRLAKPWMKPR